MYSIKSLPLKKVDLAKELTSILEQEIYSGVDREETNIEKEIKPIMNVQLVNVNVKDWLGNNYFEKRLVVLS